MPHSSSSTSTPRYRYRRRRWHWLCGLIDALGTLLWRVASWFVGKEASLPLDEVRSILLIQLDHLGDAVLSTGMLTAIRERWPTARFEILASPWNEAVFAHSPAVDAIHVCEMNRFRRPSAGWWPLAIVAWGWRLRRRRFDLAIDVRGELPHAVLMALCGAKRRVGWSAGGGGFLLTDSIDYVPGRHELDSRRALLQYFQITPLKLAALEPRFRPTSQERSRAASLVAQHLPGEQPLIVLHVGSGTLAKRWPTPHWHELLGRLIVELDVRVALVGSASEQAIARAIMGEQLVWPQVVDLTGRLSLGELGAVCERAQAVVGTDSGPAHLAAAVGTPVIALFSGTNRAEQWRPVGEQVRVLQRAVACAPCHRDQCPLADHPCLTGLHPLRVIAELRTLLTPLQARRLSFEELHDRSAETAQWVVNPS